MDEKEKEDPMKLISVKLPLELIDRIKLKAKAEGLSQSALIRSILHKGIRL